MKINVRSRETQSNKKKVSEFKMKLETTMNIWQRNSLEVMTNEKDKSFLRGMIGDQKASMGLEMTSQVQQRKKLLAEIQMKKEARRRRKCVRRMLV